VRSFLPCDEDVELHKLMVTTVSISSLISCDDDDIEDDTAIFVAASLTLITWSQWRHCTTRGKRQPCRLPTC